MRLVHHANVFVDPTPNAIINRRFMLGITQLVQHTDLTKDEQETLLRLLIFISVKLASVWKHKEPYGATEDTLVAAAKAAASPQPPIEVEYRVSQELFLELDEFLVQVKSCLDHLVKVPLPILGKWSLRTFGDKGDAVAKVLQNNMPRRFKNASAGFTQLLVRDHQPWLEVTVALRDRINHFLEGGVRIEQFSIYVTRNGEALEAHTPMWSKGQTVRQALEVIWTNLFRYVEQFVGTFLSLRQHTGLLFMLNSRPLDSVEPGWRVGLDAQAAGGLRAALGNADV